MENQTEYSRTKTKTTQQNHPDEETAANVSADPPWPM